MADNKLWTFILVNIIACSMVHAADFKMSFNKNQISAGEDVSVHCVVTLKEGEQSPSLLSVAKLYGDVASPFIIYAAGTLADFYKEIPDKYMWDSFEEGNEVHYSLDITGASKEDSGQYGCGPLDDPSTGNSATLEVTDEIDEVSLTVERHYNTNSSGEDQYMLNASCIIQYSIPHPEAKIYVGSPDTGGDYTSQFMIHKDYQFREEGPNKPPYTEYGIEYHAEDLQLKPEHYGKDLVCVGTVPGTSFPSKTATSTLDFPHVPVFDCKINQEAELGATDFSIQCKVWSMPTADKLYWGFSWDGQTQELHNGDRTSDGVFSATEEYFDGNTKLMKLTITVVDNTHFMYYELKGENEEGMSSVRIRLVEEGTLPDPDGAVGLSMCLYTLLILPLVRMFI